ncbi:carboxypeptidase-like regulatory domain-containing protein [Marimonas lutisalis]|uniref:carboxypeptidase-like regulatory domain-containing protein n=1 Tax=Marimonas lutisalis TaxID=2545756 RepID=UPI0010F672DD|nr:carboxypeptidase-like regulatory domain-containing protein [Marimonas lutisalis]
MSPKKTGSEKYVLRVPIDASGVEDRSELKALKAVFVGKGGVLASTGVKLDRDGQGVAEFRMDRPHGGQVILGPPDADDDELPGLQTLHVDISPRLWAEKAELLLDPVIVHPWYWHWWLRWCRTFVIRGKLVCPDGNPVPGAEVCAFDVDRFWWWCSKQQVGCATTDANGNFTIKFRWCCGWWPWWWWRRRVWQVDPKVFRLIDDLVRDIPEIVPLPKPDPVPSTEVLDRLLADGGTIKRPPEPIAAPERLSRIRPDLVRRLPAAPHLEALRIWPWVPWHPWTDCTPDIIFHSTQDCGQGEVVILDESCGDARWNIPTLLDVTLVATNEACCVQLPPTECEDEECIVLTHVCDDLVATIGGNLGAQATPEGYRNPSPPAPPAGSYWHDRPYGGIVPIRGVCTDWFDYYAFEYSGDGGTTWAPLPPAATLHMSRTYFDFGGPPWFQSVPFNFAMVDGKWVCETLGHWESVNGPRTWVGDRTVLLRWQTANLFSDGVYHLRLRAYREAGGALIDLGIPDRCTHLGDNDVAVAIDNRIVGPGSGHPTSPSHPVPPGGVHLETTEPDTDFVSITLGGGTIGPCGNIDRDAISPATPLVIEFMASDSSAHLARYSLRALWGENNAVNLLNAGTLSMVGPGQPGPTYGAAIGQGAAAPKWEGGTMRLTITDGEKAFPEPCCYLLDLWAWKRTIVNCDEDYNYRNHSTMTLAVT